MAQITRTEIADLWIEFAKQNINNTDYPEPTYFSITDEQWGVFGYIMSYVNEKEDFPYPTGTEDRSWYRAYGDMIAGGKDYCKEVANRVIEGEVNAFANDYHIIALLPYINKILK